MAEYGNKLLAQLGCFTLGRQRLLAQDYALLSFQLQRDQFGIQVQRVAYFLCRQGIRLGIKATQGTEKLTVLPVQGNGKIALKTILPGCCMVLVISADTDAIDNDRFLLFAYGIAQ